MPSFTLTNMAKADLKGIALYTQEQWGRGAGSPLLRLVENLLFCSIT